jgi:hypothetical protein
MSQQPPPSQHHQLPAASTSDKQAKLRATLAMCWVGFKRNEDKYAVGEEIGNKPAIENNEY